MNLKKVILGGMSLCVVISALTPIAEAKRYHRYDRRPTYFSQHPYVKKGLIGGGAGAAVGALVSPEGRRASGATKGAVLGGAAGLGLQYLQDHR